MSKSMITGGMNVSQLIPILRALPDTNRIKIDDYINTIKRAFTSIKKQYKTFSKKEVENINNLTGFSDENGYSDDNAVIFANKRYNLGKSSNKPPSAPPPPPTDTESIPGSYKEDESILEKGGVVEGEKKPVTQLSLRDRITKLGVEVPESFNDAPPGPEIATAEIVSRINTNLIPPIQALIGKFPSAKTIADGLDMKIDEYNTKNPETPVKNVTIKSVVGGKRRRNKKIGTKKKKHKRK